MKKQRIFRLMIMVTFCVFVCGFPSVRADTDGDFNYTINPDGLSCTITGYTGGTLSDVDIPDTLGGYTVTAIGANAFEYAPVTGVTIPTGVISIENQAFYYCTGLEKVSFDTPSRVTSIGDKAFYECVNLTDITLPPSLTSIGFMAFYYCSSLTNITLPPSVISIGEAAFEYNGLTDITIPPSVTSLGKCTFYGCHSLTSITIPSSVTSLGEMLFYGCNNLSSITIPSSVTSIGDNAFYKCNLTSITIPSSVTSIGNDVFYNCRVLTSVIIPPSVTSIGKSAFGNSGLTSITIPSSVTFIDVGAFSNCTSLAAIHFTGNAPSLGGAVFDSGVTIYYKASYGESFSGWSCNKVEIDDIPPVLSNITPTALKAGTLISATSNETGAIYLVPKGTYTDKNALDAATTKITTPVTAGSPVNIDTTGLTDGVYQVYAVNNTGNPEACSALELTSQLSAASADIAIGNAPVISFTRPLDGAKLNINTGSMVIAKLYDIGTGIDTASITIQIDNGTAVKPTALVKTGSGYTLYYVITNINYGTADYSHTITVTAKDGADNVTVSRSVTFTMGPKRNGFGFGRLRFD